MAEEVKLRRLQEIIATFRERMLVRNKQNEDGRLRLVLVEGLSSKATAEDAVPLMTGRTDGNKRVLFPTVPSQLLSTPFDSAHISRVQSMLKRTPSSSDSFITSLPIQDEWQDLYSHLLFDPTKHSHSHSHSHSGDSGGGPLATGDELRGKYAVVHVHNASGQTLRGRVLGLTSMVEFHRAVYPALLAGP